MVAKCAVLCYTFCMSDIIGHTSILSFFAQASLRGQLSHAYCFVGPSSVGKRTVAVQLAATMLRVSPEKLATHPDYFFVSQERNDKTQEMKKNIDVEQVRTLRSALNRRPYLGSSIVVVMDEAEKMNRHAANALLKITEEPGTYVTLFFVAKSADALPATIRSRCQMIHFYPVSGIEIAHGLTKRGMESTKAALFAKEASGLPGLALQWLVEPDQYAAYQAEVARFCALVGVPLYAKLQAVEDLFGDKKDHIGTRETLSQVLSVWEGLIREALYGHYGLMGEVVHELSHITRLAPLSLVRVWKQIVQTKKFLEQNIHPRLLVEQVLLALP